MEANSDKKRPGEEPDRQTNKKIIESTLHQFVLTRCDNLSFHLDYLTGLNNSKHC